jgi:hypothetical protein
MSRIDDIKVRCEKATPGPWMWDIRTATKSVLLETAHSGRYYVMGFERWGTQGACPRFQEFKKYEGPVGERGSCGMKRADKYAKSLPGKEHHEGFDDYIDHPDAIFIEHSKEDVEFLLSELERVTVENSYCIDKMDGLVESLDKVQREYAKMTKERDAAIADMKQLASQAKYGPCAQCLHHGNPATLYFCKQKNPCPNMQFEYFEWRGPENGGQADER